ncbi:MAG: formylglycine-generating enzyme family protein [Thermosynechococcaceae cyanobacterium]
MKRRIFLQYAGGAGLMLAVQDRALALIQPKSQNPLGLNTFEFDVSTVDQTGTIKQRQTHQAKYFPEAINGAKSLEMVAIASGKFTMGSSNSKMDSQGYDLPSHRVKLPSFYISKHPITQAQWAAVAALPKVKRDLDPDPSHFQGQDRPVESVSWLEAVEFCDRISKHTGRHYQLPSEAQWEYACRAGTKTPFHTGETITSQLADYIGTATYRAEAAGEYRQSTLPVGHFSPNAFGLHDMHGNVWEWCSDCWSREYRRVPKNALAQGSQMRAIRGGGWLDTPTKIRSASRSGYLETALNRTIGFRISTV